MKRINGFLLLTALLAAGCYLPEEQDTPYQECLRRQAGEGYITCSRSTRWQERDVRRSEEGMRYRDCTVDIAVGLGGFLSGRHRKCGPWMIGPWEPGPVEETVISFEAEETRGEQEKP